MSETGESSGISFSHHKHFITDKYSLEVKDEQDLSLPDDFSPIVRLDEFPPSLNPSSLREYLL
jgi:hypothetical protein